MKNEDLLKLKIEVLARDDSNFLELAVLFDKPEFLEMLPQLRKDYDITTLLDYDGYYAKTDSLLESMNSSNEHKRINISKYKNPQQLIDYAKNNGSDLEGKMDPYQRFDAEANLLCFVFKRPPYFAECIQKAIFCGVVIDYSLRTATIQVVENNKLSDNVADFQLPQVAIIISPSTTDKVIKEAVKVARTLYKTDSRLKYYKPRTDKVNKIRNYRDWYWEYLSGDKSYADIASWWADKEEIGSNDAGIDDNRILKGINYYKKLLTM